MFLLIVKVDVVQGFDIDINVTRFIDEISSRYRQRDSPETHTDIPNNPIRSSRRAPTDRKFFVELGEK
jgi:hypothetical protein